MALQLRDKTGTAFSIADETLRSGDVKDTWERAQIAGLDVGDLSTFREKTGQYFVSNQPKAPSKMELFKQTNATDYGTTTLDGLKQVGSALIEGPKGAASVINDIGVLFKGGTRAGVAKLAEQALLTPEEQLEFQQNFGSAPMEEFIKNMEAAWEPQSEQAQAAKSAIMWPEVMIDKLAYSAGDKALEKSGSPELATGVYTTIHGATMFLPWLWQRKVTQTATRKAEELAAAQAKKFQDRVQAAATTVLSEEVPKLSGDALKKQAMYAARAQNIINSGDDLRFETKALHAELDDAAVSPERVTEIEDNLRRNLHLQDQITKDLQKTARRLGIADDLDSLEQYQKFGLPKDAVDFIPVPDPNHAKVVAMIITELEKNTDNVNVGEVINALSRLEGVPLRTPRTVSLNANETAVLARNNPIDDLKGDTSLGSSSTGPLSVTAKVAENGEDLDIIDGFENLEIARQRGEGINITMLDQELTTTDVIEELLSVDDLAALRYAVREHVKRDVANPFATKQDLDMSLTSVMNILSRRVGKLPEGALTDLGKRARQLGYNGDEVGLFLADMVKRTGRKAGQTLQQFSAFENDLKALLFRLCG